MEKNAADLKRFDYVLFDTPSNLGLLTLNALAAAECAVVPVAVGPEALSGMENVTRYIERTRTRFNGDLRLFGAVPVLYDPTNSAHLISLVGISDYFGDSLFKTPVRKNRAVAEALSEGYNIFEYAPDSRATSDYMAGAEELALRM
jgi:chromosome partitioning protein